MASFRGVVVGMGLALSVVGSSMAAAQAVDAQYVKNHELACSGWFKDQKGTWYDTANVVWVNDKTHSWYDSAKKVWVTPNCAKAADAAGANSAGGGAAPYVIGAAAAGLAGFAVYKAAVSN